MTAAAWDIDGIVREVIRRLRDDPASERGCVRQNADVQGVPPHSGECSHEVDDRPAEGRADPRELAVTDRVVSLASVDGRLAGIRCLVTRSDAVITPSVRDELRARRIELVRRSNSSANHHEKTKVVLTMDNSADNDGQAAAKIAAEIGQADQVTADDLPTSVRRTAERIVDGGAIGVLLTEQPVAAHYLANQVRGVRAAWAVDRATLEQAVDTIGANLLIVAPGQTGVDQTMALVRQFVDGGLRPCPSDLSDMLRRVR